MWAGWAQAPQNWFLLGPSPWSGMMLTAARHGEGTFRESAHMTHATSREGRRPEAETRRPPLKDCLALSPLSEDGQAYVRAADGS